MGGQRAKEGESGAMLDDLGDLPIVEDVRGTGPFHAMELVKDPDKLRFSPAASTSSRRASGGSRA